MSNLRRMVWAAVVAGLLAILVVWVAGFYAIPLAIAGVGIALMLIGNYLGIYALPPATATLLKKVGWYLAAGVVVVWGIGVFLEKRGEAKKAIPSAAPAVATSAAKPEVWDMSQRQEESIQESRELVTGKMVTVNFPCYRVEGGVMWYQITASPHVPVEYDFLDGQPPLVDGPGKVLAVKRWPPVIKIKATEKGGKIEFTLIRQFLPDPKPELAVKKQVTKEVKKTSQKKVRTAKVRKEDLPVRDDDIPRGPQIM